MGYLFLFDGPDHGFGIKLGVKDVGSPNKHSRHEGQEGPVKDNGTAMEDNTFRGNPIGGSKKGAVHGTHIMGMDNSFGEPGGAAAVDYIIRVLIA